MTKRGLFFVFAATAVVVFFALVFIFRAGFSKKKAAVSLNAFPKAKVYIDNKEAGSTPYENDNIAPGEITLKLVPEATYSASFEKKLVLNPETLTIVNWEFDADSEKTAGDMISLEKTGLKDKAGLQVICQPDACTVSVDGEMRGFAPLSLEDIGEGGKKISLSHPGYKTREVIAKTIKNYRLVVETKLAKEIITEETEEEKEATVSAQKTGKKEEVSLEKPYVVIEETPTGWLRVRMEPSATATEAAKINPGDKFPLLDEENGWYKIEYKKGENGWISGKYAEKFE